MKLIDKIAKLSTTQKLTAVLLVALILSTFFIMHLNKISHEATKLDNNISDGFMTAVKFVQYDNHGQIQRNLSTSDLTHYVKDDTLLFNNPEFIIYSAQESPWYIRAAHGSSKENQKVLLWGGVKLFQPPANNRPATTITLNSLAFYPKNSLVVSDQKVLVQQTNTKIEGTGIRANLNKGWFQLLSAVRGFYVPTS